MFHTKHIHVDTPIYGALSDTSYQTHSISDIACCVLQSAPSTPKSPKDPKAHTPV